jgi:SAM-dependent methyltransferase
MEKALHPDPAPPPVSSDDEPLEGDPGPEEPRFWSSPAYIAASARLFGVSTAPVELASIIEIGCASGRNIIPMAARHPHASFIGVDPSPRRIAAARRHAAEVGLSNIAFHLFDIASDAPDAPRLEEELGRFDYLIVHGADSFLAAESWPTFWQLCLQLLNPEGLLYLSYNTLPYCYLKLPMLDAIAFHARHQSDQESSLSFAHDVAEHAPGLYGQVLREGTDEIEAGDEHHPVYVKELLDEAESFGLRYICEATPTYSSLRLLDRQVAATIERYSGADRILREQYIDFYIGRAFRRSLFARATHAQSVPLDLIPAKIDDLHIIFADLPPAANFAEPTRSLYYFDDAYFDVPSNGVADPLRLFAERAIAKMAQTLPAQPRSISVQEIYVMFAAAIHENPRALDTLRSAILEFFYQRKVAFSAVPLTWEFDPKRPRGQRLVVSDAAHGRSSTVSVLHDEIYLRGENVRQLLALLDGKRTREEIVADLFHLIQTGRFKFLLEDDTWLPPEELMADIAQFLDEMLVRFGSLRILTK